MTDLSRNCKDFRSRESVHARVTESRWQGTGIGRDIRQSPSRVRSVLLLIYGCTLVMEKWYCLSLLFLLFVLFLLESSVCVVGEGGFLFGVGWVVVIL